MEKEFIGYTEALSLKELGFDEPCLGKFYYNQLEIGGNWCNSDFKEDPDVFISASLYQQSFRFFRKKYKLDSFVKDLYKSTIKVGYYFDIDEYKGVKFQMDFDAWYNTYEEAELECLKVLIEMVKTK
jgi:hypothetical protein